MKKMLLTSSAAKSIEVVKDFLNKNSESKKVLFVPTATNVDEYKKYIHFTREAFEENGYETENFDISEFLEEEIKDKLEKTDILFISGGNTFYLLQELKKKNLISYLKQKIEDGLIFIGESAGSVIAAPNIEYAGIMDDRTLAGELNDYTGLNLVSFYIVPHYGEEPFAESVEKIVEMYKDRLDLKLINNKEAVLVENNDLKIIKQE